MTCVRHDSLSNESFGVNFPIKYVIQTSEILSKMLIYSWAGQTSWICGPCVTLNDACPLVGKLLYHHSILARILNMKTASSVHEWTVEKWCWTHMHLINLSCIYSDIPQMCHFLFLRMHHSASMASLGNFHHSVMLVLHWN